MGAQRLVPAVASTNAIVAALLVQEAFRFKTFCCCSASDRSEDGELENYVMYSGDAQTYMHTFALERNPVSTGGSVTHSTVSGFFCGTCFGSFPSAASLQQALNSLLDIFLSVT